MDTQLYKINYKTNTATKSEIIEHLQVCNENFEPKLDNYVNIEKYGEKLHSNAVNFEAWNRNILVGLVNVYFNDRETLIGFITNVSINKAYQKKGIAYQLLNNAIQYGIVNKFKKIQLEVENHNYRAIKLYEKYGFIKKEQKNSKLILIKTL